MNVRTVSDNPRWYAVHTRPRQEGRAESNLRAWGVEIFAPSVKERRCGQAFGNTHVFKLLFFEAGDKVLIKDGPLANLAGVFERNIKSSDRVMILLAAVRYQSHVLVNIEQVKKM